VPGAPVDARWELAQRVAESAYFRKGPKLRAFLLYVCENTLLGRPENVTAQLIGCKVFGRRPEYDLNDDTIVRVEARELRKRLEAYFAAEGRNEPMIIEIPKGTYVPVFRPREQAAAPETPETSPAGPAEEPAAPRRGTRLAMGALAAALLLVTAAAAWLARENLRLRRHVPEAAVEKYSIYSELLGTLGLTRGRETLLVLSNPPVLTYYGSESSQPEGPPGTAVRAPKEMQSLPAFTFNKRDTTRPYHYLTLSRGEFTGMGEAVAAYGVGELMRTLRRPLRLTQCRFLNWDHVPKQDLILLGGPASNDWRFQNDARSNFVFVADRIENANPLPGEGKEYRREASENTTADRADYGVVRMATSPFGFKMLLLAGLSSAGTAAAAEFFCTPEKMEPIYRRLRAASSGKAFPPDWEVLVRTTVRDGLPVDTTALAVRRRRRGRGSAAWRRVGRGAPQRTNVLERE
jgi:hypothetical protein